VSWDRRLPSKQCPLWRVNFKTDSVPFVFHLTGTVRIDKIIGEAVLWCDLNHIDMIVDAVFLHFTVIELLDFNFRLQVFINQCRIDIFGTENGSSILFSRSCYCGSNAENDQYIDAGVVIALINLMYSSSGLISEPVSYQIQTFSAHKVFSGAEVLVA